MSAPVIFFGTPDFAVPTLRALLDAKDLVTVRAVVTQPDKPAGRGKHLLSSPVKQAALEAGAPVFTPSRLRKEHAAFLDELAPLGPLQLGIVIAYGQILPLEVLEAPLRGCVNLHGSLLPRWRGAAPMQRALLAGDTETGVCLMQMDTGLDTGPVYSWERHELSPAETFGSLHDALAAKSAELLIASLPGLLNGTLTAYDQMALPFGFTDVVYASKIEPHEFQIQWSKSAVEIERQIRAFAPAPGAYTSLGGQRLKIFSAAVAPAPSTAASLPPGTVILSSGTELRVLCGSEALALKTLQLEGRKRLEAADFLRGVPVPEGTVLC